MLILSKFRDYYDYLAGLGIDNKIVFKRHTEYSYGNGPFISERFIKVYPIDDNWHTFHICGEKLNVEHKDGKWQRHIVDEKKNKWKGLKKWLDYFEKNKECINEKYDCPIVMIVHHTGR